MDRGEVRPKALLSIGHAPGKVDELLGMSALAGEYMLACLNGQTQAHSARLAQAQAESQAS